MTDYSHIAFLVTLSLSLAGSAIAAQADEPDLEENLVRGTMARPLERKAPKYPAVDRGKGKQGWVMLSYVVSEEGKVLDPVVEDSSGNPRFERSAVDTVSRWLYEPATWDGEPIVQCRTNILVSFAMKDQRTERSFASRYNRIAGDIKAGDYDRARAGIDALFSSDNLSMNEIAYTRILAGRLEEETGNPREALRHYHKAIVSNGLWIQEDTFARALWSIVALEVQAGSLSSAFRHYDKLVEVAGSGGEFQPLTDYIKEVRAELATNTVLTTDAKLRASSSCQDCAVTWTHTLLWQHFGLDEIQGELDTVDIRCDWKRVVDTAREGVTWSVPEEWGNCQIIISGSPGTTFNVLETNDLEKAIE